jgi:NADPH:quinone reductase-like Zn-dependent oxidoreductase
MHAVHLIGNGSLEKLNYRTDVPVPAPCAGEVLIRVAADDVNNADINTRIGWYSKSITADTNSGAASGISGVNTDDASRSGAPLGFPRIQRADVCGYIVAVGKNVDPARTRERTLMRNMLRFYIDNRPYECWTLGSECDGGFAQFTVAPACETYKVDCDCSDVELVSIPCAYSTAENMPHRSQVGAEKVLATGASGGVGSAVVQLAKRRGATVIAVSSLFKADKLKALGTDQVLSRNDNLLAKLGAGTIDVVIDLAAGGLVNTPQSPAARRVLCNRWCDCGPNL